jgi:hypothetical protein
VTRTVPLALFFLLLGTVAHAQIAVTLDVQPRTFTLPATLTVTWNAPGASGCTATGGWSGAKAPSGTETVAGVEGATTFNLSCTGAVPAVTVSWTNPTKNTDGSNYTNAKHTEVYRAATTGDLTTAVGVVVAHPQTSYPFTNLPVGVSYFATKAVNQAGVKSNLSATANANVQGSSGSAPPVTVTGSTEPPPPTGVVAISTTAFAVKPNELQLRYLLDGIVGTVPLGVPCDETRQIEGTGYYAVNRKQYVTWTTGRRPSTVVVNCAPPSEDP